MPTTTIYKAIIKAFDAATYTATVQIVGSIPSYLTGVPVAHHLRANLLAPGAKCGVLFFDETNPTDAAVVLLFGGAPATADFDVDGDLNVDGLITVAGTVDGVDVSAHVHSGAGQGGTVGHGALSGVSADQHHAQSHTHSHDTELTGVSADDHHAQSHTHASHPTTGDLTLDGKLTASVFQTLSSFANIDAGATTTIFTVVASSTWLIAITQGGNNWTAVGIVSVPEGSVTAELYKLGSTDAQLQLAVSGLNVQVYNGWGIVRTVKWRAIAIGP